MTLEEASSTLNAIALRFGEFAIADTETAAEWTAIAKLLRVTSDIALQNSARYQKRAESREREAKAILFVLLKLSEALGDQNGRRRDDDAKAEASGDGRHDMDGASQGAG